MVKLNVWKRMFPERAVPVRTYEGAVAQRVGVKAELRRTVLTCLLWEDTFYEKGNDIAKRIALTELREKPEWRGLDRAIVITDEQSHDGNLAAWTPKAYVVNVAPYRHGVSYGNGWTHIDGWSERVIDYIAATEAEAAA